MALRPYIVRFGRSMAALLVAIMLLLFAIPVEASTVLYYSQSYAPFEMRYNVLTGSASAIYTFATGSPKAVAVDTTNRKLYFSDPVEGKIYRANLDGSERVTYLAGVYAEGIAVDSANNLFYYTQAHTTDPATEYYDVTRVNLANPASDKVTLYTSLTGAPEAIALDQASGDVYFSDPFVNLTTPANTVATIFKVPFGENIPQAFMTGVHAQGLAVYSGYLYYSEAYDPNFKLYKVNLTNTASKTEIYNSATGAPGAITIDPTNNLLYFADKHSSVAKIFQAYLDGTGVSAVLSTVNAGGLAILANTPPSVVTNTGITTNEDTSADITQAMLRGTDLETVAQSNLIFTVGNTPTKGSLKMSGVSLVNGGTFTQADINDGLLKYVPNSNASGSDNFKFKVKDGMGEETALTTFAITVTDINDAPTFTKGANPIVLEGVGAQNIAGWATEKSVGPADESAQTASYSTTNDKNELFSVQPQVAADGTLTYTPATDAYGIAQVTVTLTDTGGTANGGQNSSSQTFSLTITGINDVPSFTKGANQSVLEDSGVKTVLGWATGISAGPKESSQALNFIVSNDNNALFSAQPQVAANGELTFTPALNANGSATVTVALHDNGGTTDGGVDTTAVQTFTITVTAVNDAPTFTKGANPIVLEGVGAQNIAGWATEKSVGPADESAQTASYSTTNDKNELFSVQPQVAADGTLTYTPATDAYGIAQVTVTLTDTGGTANGGVNSSSQTFSLTITGINDTPSFSKGANQTVLEDSGAQAVVGWATGISAGPKESSQALNFIVSNDNNALFSAQPQVAANGELTFTPALNANGSATVTVALHDNGGTTDGGIDTSASQTFTIIVTAVNDAPTFTLGTAPGILEDAGAQSISGWVTEKSVGPADESAQTASYSTTNDNNALFSVQPQVAADGTLTYTPATDAYGIAQVTVTLTDTGGTANGGANSSSQTFSLTITGINDVPSFTKGANQSVLEDSGVKTVLGWATVISAGSKESSQALNFIVSNDNNALFSAQPLVAANGELTFTPALNANGIATVTVALHDNGGTTDGGVDTSAEQTFTITVIAVNDAPTFTKGADLTVLEDAGPKTIAGWATGISAGTNESGQSLGFTVSNDNNSLFSVQPQVAANGTLTYTPAANAYGTAQVNVTLTDNGGTANGGENSTSNTFAITVTAVNDAPVLTGIGNKTVNEGALLAFTAVGTDNDLPANTLSFSLVGAPPGAVIHPVTGAFTWTPTEAQGPGSYTFSVKVTDNGAGNLSAEESITVTVNEINNAPVLVTIGDKTVNEGTELTFTASATDADLPANILAFSLAGVVPTGASINATTGTFTWTPTEAQGVGSYTFTVKVTDDGAVNLSAEESITVTVNEINTAPVLAAISNKTVDEGTELTFTASSTDADLPASTLTYSLAGAPVGASINATTGAFSWTPTEAQGPGSYTFSVKVTDNGAGSLSDEESITVTVNEINTAPVLASIGNRTVNSETILAFTASVTDDDLPANTITYSLEGAPTGASINSATGTFTWIPTQDQALSSYTFKVKATDNGTGNLSDEETITVTVNYVNTAPTLDALADLTLLSNPGPQTVSLSGIGAGGTESQGLTVTAVSSNSTLIGNLAVDYTSPNATGTLSFTPSGSGEATITVIVKDDGGTASGGVEATTSTFNVIVAYPESRDESPNPPPIPETIITDLVKTNDDKALNEVLANGEQAILNLASDVDAKAALSPAVINTLSANSKPLIIENQGVAVNFAPQSLLTQKLEEALTSQNAVLELGAKVVTPQEKEAILKMAPLGQSTGLFEIGGKMVDLTAQITATRSSGSTTEKIDSFSEPVAVTIDLSNLGVLSTEQIAQLTGVRFEKDTAGNITTVRLGGTYNSATKTFTFYTDCFSLYGVLRADRLTNINLTMNNVVATVNGANRSLDVAPTLIQNRTMVPLRFISEAFGAQVDWLAKTETVVINLQGHKLELAMNKKVPGLDVPPTIIAGRTLVPLRYISESLGAYIKWFPSSKKIEVIF